MMDYYMHDSRGYVGDYFGQIGRPFKVPIVIGILMKFFRYRVTKVPKGATMRTILTKALNDEGIHLESVSANQLYEEFDAQPINS